MNLLGFFSSHRAEILQATLAHMFLVVVSMAIAIAIGVPLGMILVKRARLRAIALGFASVLQTIPSLALFGFLIPLPFLGGIGTRTAIVALVVYALLPIVRNTCVGIVGIDPVVREAAIGMGMTAGELLRLVELPLAAPVILAG